MGERPFIEQIMVDEIGGKNSAIHAYDHMLWTVRSGFLTLFFVGWGFLLKGLLDQQQPGVADETIAKVMTPMLLVSLGLSVGGFIIDLNYVRRKFRVINALNGFLAILLSLATPDKNITIDEKKLKDLSPFLHVSGDTGDKSYQIRGFYSELTVSLVIYFIPILFLFIGLFRKKLLIL